MADSYNHTLVEKKWQERWEEEKLYVADIDKAKKPFYDPKARKVSKKPFYNLWMYPYPSAEGLHAGHAFASTGSDVYGRFIRMRGREVFQPIGYDSFGIHSENYAIKINENPHEVVKRTTKHYEEQLRSLGHGYDWTRTVTTSDVDYYRWTQWLFLEMFKAGLAYKKKAQVNFCPSCKTVLADEQVMTPAQAGKEPKDASGKVVVSSEEARVCERCGTVVEKRDLDQWFMRITDYAERLLTGLEKIDWSERVKLAQKEWIGKKEGVIIHHKLKGSDKVLNTFSAYPAWLFADTFLVMAPEHPLVNDLVKDTKYEKDILTFVDNFKKFGKDKRKKLDEKEGVFTGSYVIDPFSGREMPVWLANFALMDFGTGIIRCSAHDVRDYEFATKYKIPLREVVERTDPNLPINAHGNEGVLKDSGPFTGKAISPKLIQEILDWIEKEKIGKRTTTFHLRDWLVSRQRYWGAPIPMIHCKNCEEKGEGYLNLVAGPASQQPQIHPQGDTPALGLPVARHPLIHKDHSNWDHFGWWPEENLPVTLPPMKEYKPEGTGKGPLSHHPEFYEVKCPHCGADAERETDVMDTFVDSSWYFLRYPSVRAKTAAKLPFDPVISDKWLPVNLYFGGAEHSVLHLMYARFVNMVMHDLKLVKTEEPFPKFFAHGLMIKDGAKMSKSRGNVVNPDDYIKKFGADALRLYLAFMGPMDSSPDFRDSGMEGASRFLGRVWRLFTDSSSRKSEALGESQNLVLTKLHQTIKGVTEDIEQFKYNTAIAKIMELVNAITEHGADRETLKNLTLLLAPFAPHMMEEVWVERLGMPFSVHKAPWPSYDAKFIEEKEITIILQVNGKVRGTLSLAVGLSNNEEKVTELAKKDTKIAKYLESFEIKNIIFVSGKLLNFVTV